MEKWRGILWMGIILGVGIQVVDVLVENIPNVIIIPFQMVAIILIFTGFIIRKREKGLEK